MLVDAHAHLEFPSFESDRKAIVRECAEKDIVVVDSIVDLQSAEAFLDFARSRDNLHCCIGCGPAEITQESFDAAVALLRKFKNDVVGLGEVGLDYYWVKEKEKYAEQRRCFEGFIALSKELGLPLVIHSRDAEEDAIRLLRENDAPALLHCYSGSIELARKAISFGCLISIPTSVCYSNPKKKLVRELPLESIVLESDAPFLAPVPKTRNTPLNIIQSAGVVADVKEVTRDEVEAVTTKNASDFFRLGL